MKKTRYIIISAACIGLAFSLSGCRKTLYTEKEAVKYCRKEYGPCEVVNVEQYPGEKDGYGSVKYTLLDKEGGFEYSFSSSVNDIWIDSTIPNTPTESHGSDFADAYVGYLTEIINTENNVDITQYEPVSYEKELWLEYTDDSCDRAAIEKFCSEIDAIVVAADERDYFENVEINVTSADSALSGMYTEENGFLTDDERTEKFWLEKAQALSESAEYDHTEVISEDEFFAHGGKRDSYNLGEPTDGTVTLRYYKSKDGTLFFITNANYDGRFFNSVEDEYN